MRVGVVGAGMIGRRHIATVVASPDAELVGVADTLPADDPAIASLPCPYFRSHAELIAKGRPDAVVIATPNRLHVPMGVDCARAGVHMLVEKPIADTVDDACVLLREAKRANVALLVGHHRRHQSHRRQRPQERRPAIRRLAHHQPGPQDGDGVERHLDVADDCLAVPREGSLRSLQDLRGGEALLLLGREAAGEDGLADQGQGDAQV